MNNYEKKARKNGILSGADITKLPMKERLGKTAASTGLLLLSGLGGGFVGAATGRWSLLAGLLMAGTGQFISTPAVTAFGLGMATSNVFGSSSQPVSGTDDKKSKKEAIKERLKNYGQGLKQKLFLDKILMSKKKETTSTETTKEETTSGMGEVKYFTHPGADNTDANELDKYVNALQKEAENYVAENPAVTGTDEDLGETEQRIY